MALDLSPYKPRTFLEYRQSIINWCVAKVARLSNFNPGSRAGTFIDAVAWILSLSDVSVLNGFRSAIIEGLYKVFGFERLPGQKAVGYVRIEIPAQITDTIFPIFQIDLFGIVFETVISVTIPAGDTFIEVDVRALERGTDGNITANQIDTLDGRGTLSISTITGTRVWNPSDFNSGTEIETQEARLKRFQDFINSLGRSTILGIYNAVISIPGVAGAVVQENYNPITGYPEAGWINIFVSDGTSTPPPSLITEVTKIIKGDINDPDNYPGYAAAGTVLYVTGIDVTGITVVYELVVRADSQLSNAEAESLGNNAITNYVNTLPLGQDVLWETLQAIGLTAHPDFLKINVTTPSADMSIPASSLPRIGGTSGGTITCILLPREIPT